jgi:2-hydroxy-3-oxopropionate reductase
MAEHLIKAGHRVYLASRSGVPSGMIDGDVIRCANAADAAKDADIIITMVPDTDDKSKPCCSAQRASARRQSQARSSSI